MAGGVRGLLVYKEDRGTYAIEPGTASRRCGEPGRNWHNLAYKGRSMGNPEARGVSTYMLFTRARERPVTAWSNLLAETGR